MSVNSKKDGAKSREMITFLVGAQEFCIDVMSVREIRVWTPATPIAHAPSYVAGVINLRGTVLPIIDFAARLGFPPAEPTTRHAILVAQIGEQTVGLLVEGVSEILTITEDLIQPTPDVASEIAREFVSGIVATQNRMISLVALGGLTT
jgi:purine-binding chemotaxis protein CheW